MLYIVCYDDAVEHKMTYGTELRATYATCDLEMAEKELKKLQKTKRTASIMELPFETACDELIALYYE